MACWFTSDTHFGHENVIKYSNRPFNNKIEMDEYLIGNWNSKVKPNDQVFHLGDFSFSTKERTLEILSRLNGIKTIVLGNHDRKIKQDQKFKSYFKQVCDYHSLTIEGQKIVLSHYPMLVWDAKHYGSWMLHGHCHGTMIYPFEAKIHDVGVDNNNYFPISFEDLKVIMGSK